MSANSAMSTLCFQVVFLAAVTCRVAAQSEDCLLSPNEPPTRTDRFLASRGRPVLVDDAADDCGMDLDDGLSVIMPSLLGADLLGEFATRFCFAVQCGDELPRDHQLLYQMWENFTALLFTCPGAESQSRRKRSIAGDVCGFQEIDPLTGKEFTLFVWISYISDGVFLKSRLLEVYFANGGELYVRTPYAGRSRGHRLDDQAEHRLALQVRTIPTKSQEINVFLDGELVDSLFVLDTDPLDDDLQWFVKDPSTASLVEDPLAYSLTPFTLAPEDEQIYMYTGDDIVYPTVSTVLTLPADPTAATDSDVTTCAWLWQTVLAAGVNELISCEVSKTNDPTLQEVNLTFVEEYPVPYIDTFLFTAISRSPEGGDIIINTLDGLDAHLFTFAEGTIDSRTCLSVLGGRKTARFTMLRVNSTFLNFQMIYPYLPQLGGTSPLVLDGVVFSFFCVLFYPESNTDTSGKLPCQDACYTFFSIACTFFNFPCDRFPYLCNLLPVTGCVAYDDLPKVAELVNASSAGFQGHVRDLRIYDEFFTNREIMADFSGIIPQLEISSSCACPREFPQAISPGYGVDIWCATNYNTSLRTIRVLPADDAQGGLFLKETLVDGDTNFYSNYAAATPLWNMWVSTPGLSTFTMEVDLQQAVVVDELKLHWMTPLPDGYFRFSTKLDGKWTERQAFSTNCRGHSSTVACTPFDNAVRNVQGFTDRSQSWSLTPPVPVEAVRLYVHGPPGVWGDSMPTRYRGDTGTQYHAFTELEVYGKLTGCVCYGYGVPANSTCDHYGQCPCLAAIDIKLAGKQCMPYLTSVSPIFGPRAGGTLVTVRGALLDRLTTVNLEDVHCGIILRNSTHVICESPAAPDSAELAWNATRPITVSLPCGDLITGASFQYLPNPKVTGIEPRKTILGGGIVQTVSGENIDSVPDPYMLVFLYRADSQTLSRRKRAAADESPATIIVTSGVNRTLDHLDLPDNLYAVLVAECDVIDCCTMTCPIPELDTTGQMETNDNEEVVTLEAYVGILLDNVDDYQYLNNSDDQAVNELAQLFIFNNPKFEFFEGQERVRVFRPYPPHKHRSVEILGVHMDAGVDLGDYSVSVGTEACKPHYLDSGTLHCHAPLAQPADSNSIRDSPRVIVTVGNIQETLGYLQYEYWWHSTVFKITLSCCFLTISLGVGGLIFACVSVRPTTPR